MVRHWYSPLLLDGSGNSLFDKESGKRTWHTIKNCVFKFTALHNVDWKFKNFLNFFQGKNCYFIMNSFLRTGLLQDFLNSFPVSDLGPTGGKAGIQHIEWQRHENENARISSYILIPCIDLFLYFCNKSINLPSGRSFLWILENSASPQPKLFPLPFPKGL